MNTAASFPHHLTQIKGLSAQEIETLLNRADFFAECAKNKKAFPQSLEQETLATLFFENSTRTRASFELAAKRLGATVLNLDISTSSTSKGETLLDTLQTLEAMDVSLFVVRHKESGTANFLAENAHSGIINAGDGNHAHPTQALLDALTLRRHFGDLKGRIVTICGDISHSRVASSDIEIFTLLGMKIRLAGPKALVPQTFAEADNIKIFENMDEALKSTDAVICLRVQRERMQAGLVADGEEYAELWGLNEERLKLLPAHAVVMHPGPANRGVEITSAVADGNRSLIREQVRLGVAARMAVLEHIATARRPH
ncbi:aspartate carbamoyltransferase catalytic subunit [Acetobacteraceae bacterium]|nr:aspartate carbamoyltransferase catalytic subunit [Acetobacteraceae bacterium]